LRSIGAERTVGYRGRFAPSPTGDLHLGSAASALVGWLLARSQNGAFVLRVEDIDTPRVRPGVESRQIEDLRWLGLEWDEGPDVGGPFGPYRQSARTDRYDAAIADLEKRGLVYPCDCSRAEIARVGSAPHAGEDSPRYGGLCRGRAAGGRDFKRPPALRLRVPDRRIEIDDRLQGALAENVFETVGDFVLRRGDGIYAYQLAVVVDDLAMGITEIVRGADLLSSAARQAVLFEMLGGLVPRFAHHPMIVTADGSRLAKRDASASIRALREAGVAPARVVGAIARALGLAAAEAGSPEIMPGDLVRIFDSSFLGKKTININDITALI
jgi:glutamyl-tRNA synthetase